MSNQLIVDSNSDIILLLLRNKPIRGITRLEKLVFLTMVEGNFSGRIKEKFNFKSYKMGPFSSDVYDILMFLKSNDLIDMKNANYHISEDSTEEKNVEILSDSAANKIFKLKKKGIEIADRLYKSLSKEDIKFFNKVEKVYSSISLISLLKYVYSNYPKWTDKSEIKGRVGVF